jgi:undecaprenyl pyrophosphate phosphatase UppP
VEVGKGFWLRMVGIVIGLAVLGLLGFLIFNRVIYRFGAIGALVIVFGILMVFAYRADQKKVHEYEDAESGS